MKTFHTLQGMISQVMRPAAKTSKNPICTLISSIPNQLLRGAPRKANNQKKMKPKVPPQGKKTRWWQLKYFLFSSLPGEDSDFDYFSDGLVQPPTRKNIHLNLHPTLKIEACHCHQMHAWIVSLQVPPFPAFLDAGGTWVQVFLPSRELTYPPQTEKG